MAGMGGEYGPMLHPYAYVDGPHQNQPWVDIGAGRSTALSDGSYWAPAYHYDAHSRGMGMADPGGALLPQTNAVIGGLGGLGGFMPQLPQRQVSAPPPPITAAPLLGGGASGGQLANMQRMFGARQPVQGGQRKSPIGIVNMGLGPASKPYTRGLMG